MTPSADVHGTGRHAGDLSTWLRASRAVLETRGSADVDCDDCTACCESSQFIHLTPEDIDARAHIPEELLVSAPGLPTGHVLMGYDEQGRCPMLVDGACSIYEHRPQTCRAFDCRVFAATGVRPDLDKPLVAARVEEWQFQIDHAGVAERDALRAAADFIERHSESELFRVARRSQTGIAVTAVQISDVFMQAERRSDGEILDALAVRRSNEI